MDQYLCPLQLLRLISEQVQHSEKCLRPAQPRKCFLSGRREEEEGLDDRVLSGGQAILLDIHLRLRCPSRGSGVCLSGHKLISRENGHFNITFR
ncbi:hypothetical protein AVEN_37950-1 [Araneus ventricosus]|uniref:Uncharacterized protein n=1 Tax=Araneus ventricosus TaxID=182803 RepID=A0A4Y2PVN0_ARAVE|nr:hypothetical protein AVEN_37950-1 [Araneus ventricosus]